MLLVCEVALEKSARIPIGGIVLRSVVGSLVALTRLLELCHMLFFDFGLFLFNIRTIFSLRACSPRDARRCQSHHDRPSAVYVTCVGRMLFVTKRLRFDLPDSSNHPKGVQRLLYALYALQPVTSRSESTMLALYHQYNDEINFETRIRYPCADARELHTFDINSDRARIAEHLLRGQLLDISLDLARRNECLETRKWYVETISSPEFGA